MCLFRFPSASCRYPCKNEFVFQNESFSWEWWPNEMHNNNKLKNERKFTHRTWSICWKWSMKFSEVLKYLCFFIFVNTSILLTLRDAFYGLLCACVCDSSFVNECAKIFVETWLLHIIQWNRFDTNDPKEWEKQELNTERHTHTHTHTCTQNASREERME